MTMNNSALFGRVVILSLCCLVVACASATAPVAVPGPGDETIPRGALRALEARWSRVELGSSISATCPGTSGAPVALVRGDVNGDGTEDIVLWMTAGGTPRLVAVLARLDGEYTVAEVGDGSVTGPTTLEIARRGTAYRLASLTIDFFFGTDTVVLRACDGIRTAWFWTGGTFQGQPLAN